MMNHEKIKKNESSSITPPPTQKIVALKCVPEHVRTSAISAYGTKKVLAVIVFLGQHVDNVNDTRRFEGSSVGSRRVARACARSQMPPHQGEEEGLPERARKVEALRAHPPYIGMPHSAGVG